MRSSGGINHACKLAGVVVIAVLLAACARHGTPQEYGLGSTGSVATPGSPQEFAVDVGDLVHFQQDSSGLTGEAKSILLNQVRWLNRYTQYDVTIEGHADERGTREYNLALGARRAMAVKGFLASSGVAVAVSARSPTARNGRLPSATSRRAGTRTAAPRRCSTTPPWPETSRLRASSFETPPAAAAQHEGCSSP